MSKHFSRDMQRIDDQILALFGLVEKMIDGSVRALCERQNELIVKVLETDTEVDSREVQIEEECLKALALHQPVAGNLRRIATLLKISSMLERVADLACNISKRARELEKYPYFPIPDLLPRMAAETIHMVKRALDSFVNLSVTESQEVISMDEQVDELSRQVIVELEELMKLDPKHIRPAMQCFSASRHLERIADLAENIAKDVIYLVSGEVVRHRA